MNDPNYNISKAQIDLKYCGIEVCFLFNSGINVLEVYSKLRNYVEKEFLAKFAFKSRFLRINEHNRYLFEKFLRIFYSYTHPCTPLYAPVRPSLL